MGAESIGGLNLIPWLFISIFIDSNGVTGRKNPEKILMLTLFGYEDILGTRQLDKL